MEMSADHSTTEPTDNSAPTRIKARPSPIAPRRADELSQLEDRWRRAVADLDNLRKRYAKDLDRERAAEVAKVSAAWLPILDNLELALAHAGSDPQAVVEGVKAILDQAGTGALTTRLRAPRRGRCAVLPGTPRGGQCGNPTRPSIRDRGRGLAPGLWRGRATVCGPPRWSSAAQRGEHRWPVTTTKYSAYRRAPAPTKFSRRTASWPASTTPM